MQPIRLKLTGISTVAAICLAALPLRADDLEDALTAALAAYGSGDLSSAAVQIDAASRAIRKIQGQRLAAFLPEAPEGWRLEPSDDADIGFDMMGGMMGTMVEARYQKTDGSYGQIGVTLAADSPLAASMGAMLGSPQMMARMGKVVKVGGIDMLDQGDSLVALVGARILVQGSAPAEDRGALVDILSRIDFAALPRFDH